MRKLKPRDLLSRSKRDLTLKSSGGSKRRRDGSKRSRRNSAKQSYLNNRREPNWLSNRKNKRLKSVDWRLRLKLCANVKLNYKLGELSKRGFKLN